MSEVPIRHIAVVLASGASTRFGADIPKQFLKVSGKTVLEHTLDVFERHSRIDEIVVVSSADNLLLTEELVKRGGYKKVTKLLKGGDTRQRSSACGINAIQGDDHKVLVHDAVRPLLDHATIDRCLDALDSTGAVDTTIPASDTIVRVSPEQTIAEIPDRSALHMGQTPQGFRSGLLREAHRRASNDADLKVTDDCGLILRYGLGPVQVVRGDVNNIKITYPSDIYLVDRIFQLRARGLSDRSDLAEGLHKKVLVIFGASRGIGQSIATLASQLGAYTYAVSRQSGVDVRDEWAVRRALREAWDLHGRVDYVINTAGVLRAGLLAGQQYSDIDEQISTNLRGSFVVAREAFESMKEVGGSIVLFTSSSYTRGRARYSVYSATKAAIVNLVQALAEEFLPFNVRINALNPERTDTPMRRENFGVEPSAELLTADQVARASLLACLGKSTGEVLDVRR